jgi:Glutathione S-transferase, N-terminal domain
MYLFQHNFSRTLTMVLKLYGIYRSPFVRLVAAVLLEKQVPFELVPVDFDNKEHKSPEYLAKHPFGQIPYIVGDSLVFCLPAKLIQFILIRTMTASSSTKAKQYAII